MKFDSSLTKDQNCIIEIKKIVRSFCTTNRSLFKHQLKWELLKYQVLKFTINYTKHIAKEKRQQQTNLENQLKIFEESLDDDGNLSKHNAIKNELDTIYERIIEDIRIRSKCHWYERSEKLRRFVSNVEKQQGVQNTIKKLIVDDKEITDQGRILECIRGFNANKSCSRN